METREGGWNVRGGAGRAQGRGWRSLSLGDGDGGALGVVEAVHGVQLHDHVEAVSEDQHHEEAGHQTHPDPRGEEAGAVAGVRELAVAHVKALDLWGAESQTGERPHLHSLSVKQGHFTNDK